ncbi:hypothetical protein DK419_13450 [Methylobacterium terrae]|uniref:Uncharacterized protein n=1 Tax=Methylobacterium terrae TaxID=2202827 RepID=A0A2U8WM33_9HYPH|nr:hypothetical protein DK419_13450 [Methylobacterium terrae]
MGASPGPPRKSSPGPSLRRGPIAGGIHDSRMAQAPPRGAGAPGGDRSPAPRVRAAGIRGAGRDRVAARVFLRHPEPAAPGIAALRRPRGARHVGRPRPRRRVLLLGRQLVLVQRWRVVGRWL